MLKKIWTSLCLNTVIAAGACKIRGESKTESTLRYLLTLWNELNDNKDLTVEEKISAYLTLLEEGEEL